MTKYYGFFVWILATQLSFGEPNGSERSQNGSVKGFLERDPYKVNGRDVRLAIESFDYNKGTGSEAWLDINIDMPIETLAIAYRQLKVTVLDAEGHEIAAEPVKQNIAIEEKHQYATFKMELRKGQKIESVRIRWGDSDRSFRYSKGQIGDIFVF
jgi:hypothetical protein